MSSRHCKFCRVPVDDAARRYMSDQCVDRAEGSRPVNQHRFRFRRRQGARRASGILIIVYIIFYGYQTYRYIVQLNILHFKNKSVANLSKASTEFCQGLDSDCRNPVY